MSTGHQPGLFKRPAKPHKTFKGKRSKGQIDADNRGRVSVANVVRSRKRCLSKAERHQQAAQIRANKRRSVLEKRRGLHGGHSAPTLITIISCGGSLTPAEFVESMVSCDDTIVRTVGHNVVYLSVGRFKSRVGLLTPNPAKIDDVLDCIKVSDVVCFLWPTDGELSEENNLLLTIIKAHGLPSIVNVIPNIAQIPIGKKREETRKQAVLAISNASMNDANRVFFCDTELERKLLVRHFVEMKKNKMLLQKRRPHILVEKLDVADDNSGICTVLASGYLRGPSWNVNHLIHIQGWGDFQLGRIMAHTDPHPLKQNERVQANGDEEPKVLVAANESLREPLQSEIVPDPMDAEQTWPDEYDVSDDGKVKIEAGVRKVPKGTSSYQAAWIVDDDEDEESEDDEESIDEDEEEGNCEAGMEMEMVDESDHEGQNAEETDDAMSTAIDDDEADDFDEVEKYRREREDAQFPDEIDTPINDLARIRFQKYRGLKSFRTSPWDAKENLPSDYARIFQFQNYKKTRKTVLSAIGDHDPDTCALPGQYVTLEIIRVPVTFAQQWDQSSPLVLYQLLPHEQRMSVLNMVIRRHPTCRVPIMNKQKLIFYIGFRKFEACPVFSQHTNGNKFKMERFLPTDACCVASVYAPITFPPASVLVFREGKSGVEKLVATGSLLDVNPDRVVLKRIVLSGHPFKINKRSVVCRYMFFNREDIEWFKPVELYTPSGRRGHIKEALGTHGHMKCRFDQQLNAADSVMMSLYKRVFPKWTYNPRVGRSAAVTNAVQETEAMDE
ncbi:hypothetical protein Q1695_012815 [Nippostrongylus brasiliensis]|nr:hypothetical protein Q1695_012815 [Nippostrongylus brasiliensis]